MERADEEGGGSGKLGREIILQSDSSPVTILKEISSCVTNKFRNISSSFLI